MLWIGFNKGCHYSPTLVVYKTRLSDKSCGIGENKNHKASVTYIGDVHIFNVSSHFDRPCIKATSEIVLKHTQNLDFSMYLCIIQTLHFKENGKLNKTKTNLLNVIPKDTRITTSLVDKIIKHKLKIYF